VSRLDSFINRVTAQRTVLNFLAPRLVDMPGPVLELGLGNGRTYSHLRELFPARDIWVFEFQVAAHPDSIPPDRLLILGDFRTTVPGALGRIGHPAPLIHADFGSGNAAKTAELAAWLGPHLRPLLARGGYIASDQPLAIADTEAVPLPAGAVAGSYNLRRSR
jgi:hypothetical protein